MIDLSLEQAKLRIERLLTLTETRTLDFKRVGGKHSKIYETICAFANTAGGIIAFGIGDVKDSKTGEPAASRLFGIEENPEWFDDLQRRLINNFAPPVSGLHWLRLPCTLRDGQPGHIVMLRIEQSAVVHSIINDGTWIRMNASNREMSAAEITELSYQRGTRSATSEPIAVSLALLDTATWKQFLSARGALTGSFAEQLEKIGLAQRVGSHDVKELQPTRAAVLLFAEEPGGLLAAHDARADIRVMVYDGNAVISGATPNFRKPPKTVRGPLIEQIDKTVRLVLDEIAQGVTLSRSGFRAKHAYPERVVKEAIVNAIIHRDYRLNRDIFVRIFDDRIEVESPGTFPAKITPGSVSKAGSNARNPMLARNLREFPTAPNLDAGEGVKMMFAEMDAAKRFPPRYLQNTETAVESVTVQLFNAERPSLWDEAQHWLNENGELSNTDLRSIGKVDLNAASKVLKEWVVHGWIEPIEGRGRRNAAYRLPAEKTDGLFAGDENNKVKK